MDYSIDIEVYDYWLWRYYPERSGVTAPTTLGSISKASGHIPPCQCCSPPGTVRGEHTFETDFRMLAEAGKITLQQPKKLPNKSKKTSGSTVLKTCKG